MSGVEENEETDQHEAAEGTESVSGTVQWIQLNQGSFYSCHSVTFVHDGSSTQLVKDAQLSDTVETMKQYLSSQLDRPTEGISISYVGQSFTHSTVPITGLH